MADAVIVSTSRTPIGRANKGSLVDARPDDMSAHTLSDVLSKVDMDPNEVEDVIWGIGQPGGEGLQHRSRDLRPAGPRPSWRHRQPLLLVVVADHPHGRPRNHGR